MLTEYLSWRVGFFVKLPIGVAMIIGARRHIAESARGAGQFDLSGAVASAVGMSALVYAFIRSASAGWSDPITLGALVAALVLLAMFVRTERKARQPIMPLRLFASRERCAAYVARALFLGAMIGFFFFTMQFLEDVVHFPRRPRAWLSCR